MTKETDPVATYPIMVTMTDVNSGKELAFVMKGTEPEGDYHAMCTGLRESMQIPTVDD